MTEGREKYKQQPITIQEQSINYQDIFEINIAEANNYTVHQLELDQLTKRLNTDLTYGISHYRAKKLLELAGKNELKIVEKQSKIKLLIKEVFNRYQIPCWICCGALIFVYKVKQDDKFIFFMGLFNCITTLIGIFFILYQKSCLKSLKSQIAQQTDQKFKIIRQGNELRVCQTELVEGDIIFINEGQIIPADIRIVEYDSIESDQYCLTGETSPIKKNNLPSNQQNYILSQNILFQSCICSQGYAKGIVVKTGQRTYYNNRLETNNTPQEEDTLYNMNFIKKLRIYILFAFIIAIVFFQFSYQYKNLSIYESFSIQISVFLINYPINLFLVAFSYQYQIIKSLFIQNILVKQIYHQFKSVRTNVQVLLDINSLSKHDLVVDHLWYGGKAYQKNYDVNDLNFQALLKGLIVTCNAAFDVQEYSQFNKINYDKCPIQGSISRSEIGQLKFLQNICDVAFHQKLFKVVQNKDGSIAKNRNRTFANGQIVVVEEETKDSFYTVYIKGEVEDIIEKCSYLFANGSKVQLDFHQIQKIKNKWKQYYKTDNSVIGVAMLPLSSVFFPRGSSIQLDLLPFALKDFIFCGMISQKEELDHDIQSYIKKFKDEKINLAVLTNTEIINWQIKNLLQASELITDGDLSNLELQENGKTLDYSINNCSILVIDNKEVTEYITKNIKKLKEILQNKKLLIFSQIRYETKNILEGCGAFNIQVSRQQLKQYYSNLGVIYGDTQDQFVKNNQDVILNESNLSQVLKLIQILKKHTNNIDNFKKIYFIQTAIKILCFMLIAAFDIPILEFCFIMYLAFLLFDYLMILKQKYTKININS